MDGDAVNRATCQTLGRMVESEVFEVLRDQLEDIGRQYCEAQDRGDAAGMAELYAEDALLLWPGSSPVRGRDNIKRLFSEWLKLGVKNEKLETIAIDYDEVSAHRAGTWSLEMPNEEGSVNKYAGKFVWLFRRKAGNQWEIHLTIISADTSS